MAMLLTVAGVEPAPGPYVDFCHKEPNACALEGPETVDWSEELQDTLRSVNSAVNAEIKFLPDPENNGREESWDFPTDGIGDCEDFALEKRRRLIENGLPSASLTCAIAMHETQLFMHAVLLAETTVGTLVLDNLNNDVVCWDAMPYLYLLRERPDGSWARFQLH